MRLDTEIEDIDSLVRNLRSDVDKIELKDSKKLQAEGKQNEVSKISQKLCG